jgi:glucokinase
LRSAVGIDIGGTKVAGMRVAEDGSVLDRRERPTPAEDVSATVEAVTDLAGELAAAGGEAVGVGAAGMVDFASGTLRSAPNLAWREIRLRDLVAERTGLPCVVDNDANVAAWGEYRFGAARGYRHALVVTVGTGIGGGIVADGELFRGEHGFAAEIGHFIVEPGGPPCGCGNRGCWEQVASGRALDRAARAEVERDAGGRIAALAAGAEPSGLHVSGAAGEGDPAAVAIFEVVGRRLGEGIAGLVNILDPEVVIVGGGVAEVGAVLLEPARRAFLDAVEAPEHRPEVPILAAALGNDAGAIGAAALGLDLRP